VRWLGSDLGGGGGFLDSLAGVNDLLGAEGVQGVGPSGHNVALGHAIGHSRCTNRRERTTGKQQRGELRGWPFPSIFSCAGACLPGQPLSPWGTVLQCYCRGRVACSEQGPLSLSECLCSLHYVTPKKGRQVGLLPLPQIPCVFFP